MCNYNWRYKFDELKYTAKSHQRCSNKGFGRPARLLTTTDMRPATTVTQRPRSVTTLRQRPKTNIMFRRSKSETSCASLVTPQQLKSKPRRRLGFFSRSKSTECHQVRPRNGQCCYLVIVSGLFSIVLSLELGSVVNFFGSRNMLLVHHHHHHHHHHHDALG